MLYIIATPIGNLQDITLRSLQTLQEVDGIICEDTRRASILLNFFDIKKPLLVLNDFNEYKMASQIVERLKLGENLALISDAGTPLISDPGYKLIRQCILEGIEIDSLPGPSAVLAALTLSGMPPDKFLFLGYPPEKPGHRKDFFGKIEVVNSKMPVTNIIFVSPHKLAGTLHDMLDAYGDIDVVLAKELTKIHQNVSKKPISVWLSESKKVKGEYVVLFRL
jgi:16S rRNA (cytidine1402-2'-O)-methyltransferase